MCKERLKQMSKLWSTMAKSAKPYVPGEQPKEADVLKLNTNENPYPPSPNVVSAIQREAEQKLHLYPSPTVDRLKQLLANQNGLEKKNVFVGNGSDEVLAFSFMAFFEPGNKVLFPKITYSFYPVYATLFNISYEAIALDQDFKLQTEDYFQSEGGVIFPNPNAPTSIYMPLDQVEEIVKNNPNQVVIVDEAYIDFAAESAVSLVNKYSNLLVIQTMSKSRSLAGLRVGFAFGDPNLIGALIRIKNSFNSYTLDQLAIAGAEAAISDQVYTDQITEKIIQTRESVSKRMKKFNFDVIPSQTNFIFARHAEQSGEELFNKLKEAGVLVRHFNTEPINDFIRITIGTNDQMDHFFRKLSSIL